MKELTIQNVKAQEIYQFLITLQVFEAATKKCWVQAVKEISRPLQRPAILEQKQSQQLQAYEATYSDSSLKVQNLLEILEIFSFVRNWDLIIDLSK